MEHDKGVLLVVVTGLLLRCFILFSSAFAELALDEFVAVALRVEVVNDDLARLAGPENFI